jgi:hypothetical protein
MHRTNPSFGGKRALRYYEQIQSEHIAVPIPINRNEVEIGAVQVNLLENGI